MPIHRCNQLGIVEKMEARRTSRSLCLNESFHVFFVISVPFPILAVLLSTQRGLFL